MVQIAAEWRQFILVGTSARLRCCVATPSVCLVKVVLLLELLVKFLKENLSLAALNLLISVQKPSNDLLIFEFHITLQI